MKEGPDITLLGSLIGDPARANMLTALMSGKALTASELAAEAGITAQTASSHLARLKDGGLVAQNKQGRHKYFALADTHVAGLLETMMGVAAHKGHSRSRTGPRDPELRKARVCYNHLAGEMGVRMYDSLIARELIAGTGDRLVLTDSGRDFVSKVDIDPDSLARSRRPACKPCLDWSARRTHLAGALGSALLQAFYEKGWASRREGTRVVLFSSKGKQAFDALFPI